jgi:hopanoid-associated phosphorylase
VVTGLASEAAVASAMFEKAGSRVRVVCAGASSERAARLARQLVAEGAEALLSFGIAGAVAPDLESGDLVIAQEVLTDYADLFPCDARWQQRLCAALDKAPLTFRQGVLLGSHRLWGGVGDKEAIFAVSGSLAVDMESGPVGAVAREAGLPFLAVRAVADRAADRLPAFVETAVKPDGSPNVARALAGLARRPGDIPATLRLARRTSLALASLRRLEAVKEA